MSKQILANVANESLDQLQVAREYMKWFESLNWAIKNSLKSGHDNHAEQLASVVSFLTCEYYDLLSSETERLGDQLAAADLRA